MAGEASRVRFGSQHLAHEIRQSGELSLAIKGKRVGLLVGKDILAERCAQLCEPFGDFRKTLLGLVVETSPGPAKACMVALKDTGLLRREAELASLLHQGIYARKQGGVGVDPVPVKRG